MSEELVSVNRPRAVLPECDDLRRAPWKGSENPYAGHCYVASEVLYHALGGKAAGYTVWGMKWEGSQHWWLRSPLQIDGSPAYGHVVDATWDQFNTYPNYVAGKRRSFLTNAPSKRAIEMAHRAGLELKWNEPSPRS